MCVLGSNGDDTKLKTDYIKETLATRLQWPNNPADTNHWCQQWTLPFQHKPGHVIRTTKQLAELAKNIRTAAVTLMDHEDEAKGKLRKFHKAFKTALIQDLTPKDLADTYAQTIAYGLLTIVNPFLHANGKSGKLNFDELGVQNIIELLQSNKTDFARHPPRLWTAQTSQPISFSIFLPCFLVPIIQRTSSPFNREFREAATER